MKIIDLLNMISKGEDVPEKIRYQANSHKMDLYTYNEYTGDYQREIGIDLFTYLFSKERIPGFLNDEVEIIEEDKKIKEIEQIEYYHQYDECWVKDKFYQDQKGNLVDEIIIDKINEIIDHINKEK